jgi:hypothetical protein
MADDFVWRIIGTTAWSGEYVGKADVCERLLGPLYAQFLAPSSITATRILADAITWFCSVMEMRPLFSVSVTQTPIASLSVWQMGNYVR